MIEPFRYDEGGLCPFYRGHPGVHLQYCYHPAFRINHEGNETRPSLKTPLIMGGRCSEI